MVVDSEEISYQHVIRNLQQRGWQWREGIRNQMGFDIEARKGNISLKLEIKSRTIGTYSPGGSYTQRTNSRRRFQFTDNQYDAADAFICVFVGPKLTQAYVVPKRDFDFIRQRTSEGNWLSFDPSRDYIIRGGKTIDVSKYVEGWRLLETLL